MKKKYEMILARERVLANSIARSVIKPKPLGVPFLTHTVAQFIVNLSIWAIWRRNSKLVTQEMIDYWNESIRGSWGSCPIRKNEFAPVHFPGKFLRYRPSGLFGKLLDLVEPLSALLILLLICEVYSLFCY